MTSDANMNVAIAGAGNTGLIQGYVISARGRKVTLWSPSGRSTTELRREGRITSTGALQGVQTVAVAETAAELAGAGEVVLLSVPAYGQKAVFDSLLPSLRDDQTLIITGGALSFGVLYCAMGMARAGKRTKVAVTSGPMGIGRRVSQTEIAVPPPPLRSRIAAVPSDDLDAVTAIADRTFDRQMVPVASALEVGLSAMGGIVHAALTICNLTRIEAGEEWCGYRNTTNSVSNLTEALDRERLAVAGAYGFELPDVVTHFDKTGTADSLQEALQPVAYQRSFKNGPRDISTRYIEEEIPYNLVSLELLAAKAGVESSIVSCLIDVYGYARGKDYRGMNTMAQELGLAEMTKAEIEAAFRHGFTRAG